MADAQPRVQGAPAGQQYSSLDPDSLARVTDGLIDVMKVRYGGRLSVDQIEEIRACIHTQVVAAERLHHYPLTNADEPAFMFVAYDEER